MPNKVRTKRVLCALLALASCMHTGTAQGDLGLGQSDFISLPAEFANRVPVRLVFSQAELAQCWQDGTAKRCVLRADMKLEPDAWRQAFASTGGTAALPAEGGIFTVSSGGLHLLCCVETSNNLPAEHFEAWPVHNTHKLTGQLQDSSCAPVHIWHVTPASCNPSSVGWPCVTLFSLGGMSWFSLSVCIQPASTVLAWLHTMTVIYATQHAPLVLSVLCCCHLVADPCTAKGVCLPGDSSTVHTIDFSDFPYAMLVESGAILVFDSVQLFALAPTAAYRYSAATPWLSTGAGTTTWPSIGLAPNSTVRKLC